MEKVDSRDTQRGVTLIELMIVVAILGIITMIAYPAYESFVREARRSDGMSALLNIQIEQEKYRANNTSYGTAAASLGVATVSAEGFYNISFPSASATDFLVTAAPTGAQVGDDCGTFAVDESGPNHTGSYADAACWQR